VRAHKLGQTLPAFIPCTCSPTWALAQLPATWSAPQRRGPRRLRPPARRATRTLLTLMQNFVDKLLTTHTLPRSPS
jgi:hypothetical protein